ncbi:MAG: Ppx/GppA family phosphatase [Candidatus Melainabacteria bacterium]|nr:Ppx/GppA family phosphatase [Candidatus Melainabacteria bacterium]
MNTSNERIAAIDIGSNSFHIIVAEINPESQSFKVLDRLRETVRFGTFHEPNHELTENDMKRGFETLKRFKKLAEGHHVTEIFASATSAVREARNGKEWLLKIRNELDIDAHPISGIEEARLIYLGVLSSLELKGRKIGIVDIGGGSTEFIVGDEEFIYHLSSIKSGAVRLTERDLKDESNILEKVECVEKSIEGLILTKVQQIEQAGGFDFLVGTSGTVQTIANIDYRIHNFADSENIPNLNQYKITYESLCSILEKMIQTPKEKRADAFDISKNRAEIILAGAIILKAIMKNLNVKEIFYCDRALREGLIVDKLLQKGIIKDRLQYQKTIRERSVIELANKYHFQENHALQVRKLSSIIFDKTKSMLHNYGAKEKELLEAAATLHDIGALVTQNDHHKHSYYLIRNSGLLGFNDEEVELIANIARYHRQSNPKDSHPNFQNLPRDHKKLVKELSSFLRIAEGLDKGHRCAIKDIDINPNSTKKKLKCKIVSGKRGYDCALEIWSAIGKSREFKKEFGVDIDFVLQKMGKQLVSNKS